MEATERAFREACRRRTCARLAVGHAGPRLSTDAYLSFRADHAMARDAVHSEVPDGFLEERGLPILKTRCSSREEYLLRPDLGREPDEDAKRFLRDEAVHGADAGLFVSDGLSARALMANYDDLVPSIQTGLSVAGLTMGTLFFVRFGRVAVEDWVAELTGCTVSIVLIGERPGLGGGESLSIYMAYHPTVGMGESRRTVISNIHPNGTPAVEAGAQAADLVVKMLEQRCSGVELEL